MPTRAAPILDFAVGECCADTFTDHLNIYRCDNGNSCAGSHVASSPSTKTSNVCGSTRMSGQASLRSMSFFDRRRVPRAGNRFFFRSNVFAIPRSIAAGFTKHADSAELARPKAPHCGSGRPRFACHKGGGAISHRAPRDEPALDN